MPRRSFTECGEHVTIGPGPAAPRCRALAHVAVTDTQAAATDLPGGVTEATFEALVFDWDGTAVPDRQADASAVRDRVEALCAAGVHVFVVSGTHMGNVDGQLSARPAGPGRLFLCLNRGSEVFEVTTAGPVLVERRVASADENSALDRAAGFAVDALRARGVEAQVVSQRLNRRKIDIIGEPGWADPPKARIAELLGAVTERLQGAGMTGLADVVAIAQRAARDAGLADPRVTSDVKHVEIGLTDKAHSARWAAGWLRARGVTGGLVLVGGDEFGPLGGVPGSDSLMLVDDLARAAAVSVGVEPGGVPAGVVHLGGGPGRFVELLDVQLDRRSGGWVPWIDEDPAWVLTLPDAPDLARAAEALGALSNGWAGVRGDGDTATSLFAVNGTYTDGDDPQLLPGPLWTRLRTGADATGGRRLVDLRTGVLARDGGPDVASRAVRFVSGAHPHAMALRAEAPTHALLALAPLGRPGGEARFERDGDDDWRLARTGTDKGGAIVVAARDRSHVRAGRRVVERVAAWAAGDATWDDARGHLASLAGSGFDRLLAEHRESWAERWADAEVTIEGSSEDELAARFGAFHLLSAAAEHSEAAVGARGLTGTAYGGHVFWDADVFVLPALAAIRPQAARAMLEYRIRRLPAARAAAAVEARRGARFPWESAASGADVTPTRVRGPRGELIPIRTGRHEIHIVADVAWAAAEYTAWTGDSALLAGPARGLLVETARYWASRSRRDGDGHAHLYGVMGPDEYHEVVDDNAYTNVMARWNLRRAADLVDHTGGDRTEAAAWRELADALVDGFDPEPGLYEQFAGYFDLEPLLIADVARPPVAADVLLGPERVAGSQLIKQPDVLMLHHLVPDEVAAGSLAVNLAFYGPRTAHGSSLSPAIHAALLARAGHPDQALELYRVAARLDLDDLTGTTAGGLHLAAMGSAWQALAYGFLGLRPRADGLDVDPRLPSTWDALALRLRFQGQPIGVRAEGDLVTVHCVEPLVVRVAGGSPQRCDPPGSTFTLGRTTP